MRVLFAVPRSLNPKQMYREYPLGVGFLGTILEQHGHEVRILDQNAEGLDDDSLLEQVAAYRPDAVGFSVITPNYPIARKQIRALKERHPEIRVLAGGVHASLFPEDLIADGADVVVRGEGEPAIADLADRLAGGAGLGGLSGLVFRDPTMIAQWPWRGRARPWRGLRGWGRSLGVSGGWWVGLPRFFGVAATRQAVVTRRAAASRHSSA